MELKRLTTQYDPAEDRIRLTGISSQGHTMTLWLTQRLLNRLVPHLCDGLEREFPADSTTVGRQHALRAHAVQSFAQQRARAALPQNRPVVSAIDAPQWRVETVDVKSAPDGVRLTLNGSTEANQASLDLPLPTQRQWLAMVYEQYRRAGWSTHMWPQWIVVASTLELRDVPSVLH